jgi:hypothetical protein
LIRGINEIDARVNGLIENFEGLGFAGSRAEIHSAQAKLTDFEGRPT